MRFLFSGLRLEPATLVLILCVVLVSCGDKHPQRMLVVMQPSPENLQLLNQVQAEGATQLSQIDSTTNYSFVNEDTLGGYTSLVFLGVNLDTIEFASRIDVERFAEAGGSVMFVNTSTDSINNWPWLKKLKNDNSKSEELTATAVNHVFLAHAANTEKSNDLVKKIVAEAASSGAPDYTSVKTKRVPETNRFQVEVLDTYMYEPMEMVVFNDGRILYVERRGDIKMYDPKEKKSRVIDRFDVSITGNYEDGILGVALDPDFEKNHYIYINYSPAGSVAKQNVSRFEMRGDSIIRSSEKIVLEIPTQRETCCHSGGHLEFGPGNNLYISTGDNTSSKESDGFSPIDERKGRAPFDAQKSSSNTHDLRGKILRIHPEPDGSYTIPDGNLFPKDGSQGKPEIYVMGTRNAFRFSVDPKTGYVYWGDVGPDGGVSNERGPESFDEFNQAKKPGNYGWPYFVADNKAYAHFDFATNKIGPKFNPERPENTSPNNKGAKILPPAQKPMIWYPYGVSKEFPMLGTGSRSAMAGPMFYSDAFKNAKNKFPDYYDRKLFIYEWARSWVKVVGFDEDWNLATIEPFIPGQEWYKPIDMKFGPDGSMYVLQYGANYFEHNPDSRLVKITYIADNREPVAKLNADKSVGAVPLTVKLSAKQSFDADRNDVLSYAWEFPGSDKHEINGDEATVTYSKPGTYKPVLKVTDKEGKSSTVSVMVQAGNEMPVVAINTPGTNRSFYFGGGKINYQVSIDDKEDGSVANGINASDVFVSFDYLGEGKDLALLASNAQLAGSIKYIRGKNLLENSDCKTCHNIKETSIGPSYSAIADRYKGKNVVDDLAGKILKGGNGNWGKNMMAAHPQHTKDEAVEMVKYILAVNDQAKGLPLAGNLNVGNQAKGSGFYVMRASYTDKGAAAVNSLTNSAMLVLRSPRVQAEDMTFEKKLSVRHIDGTDVTFVSEIESGSVIRLDSVDMTGIASVTLKMASLRENTFVEIHAGTKDGPLLGKAAIPTTDINNPRFQEVTLPLKQIENFTNLHFVFKSGDNAPTPFAGLDWVEMRVR